MKPKRKTTNSAQRASPAETIFCSAPETHIRGEIENDQCPRDRAFKPRAPARLFGVTTVCVYYTHTQSVFAPQIFLYSSLGGKHVVVVVVVVFISNFLVFFCATYGAVRSERWVAVEFSLHALDFRAAAGTYDDVHVWCVRIHTHTQTHTLAISNLARTANPSHPSHPTSRVRAKCVSTRARVYYLFLFFLYFT